MRKYITTPDNQAVIHLSAITAVIIWEASKAGNIPDRVIIQYGASDSGSSSGGSIAVTFDSLQEAQEYLLSVSKTLDEYQDYLRNQKETL